MKEYIITQGVCLVFGVLFVGGGGGGGLSTGSLSTTRNDYMYKLNRRLTTCVKRVNLTVSSIVVIVGFGRDSETRQRVILGFRSIFFLTSQMNICSKLRICHVTYLYVHICQHYWITEKKDAQGYCRYVFGRDISHFFHFL